MAASSARRAATASPLAMQVSELAKALDAKRVELRDRSLDNGASTLVVGRVLVVVERLSDAGSRCHLTHPIPALG